MKLKEIDDTLKDVFYGEDCGAVWIFVAVVVTVCAAALDFI